jgi:hypothetical protein
MTKNATVQPSSARICLPEWANNLRLASTRSDTALLTPGFSQVNRGRSGRISVIGQ